MLEPSLTDDELEDLAVTAYLYRHSARQACVNAAFMWAAGERRRSSWFVKDAVRLLGRASSIDGGDSGMGAS